jgi:hypothetical protein
VLEQALSSAGAVTQRKFPASASVENHIGSRVAVRTVRAYFPVRRAITTKKRSLHLNSRREATMANFTPISAAIGGALIGLSAVLLMLLNGRIAGITGIAGGLIDPISTDRSWRAAFMLVGYTMPVPQMPTSMVTIAVAGLLVGFGTRMSNGCTSGHGICGMARLSTRSIAATAVFMAAAIIVVALTRHVVGG